MDAPVVILYDASSNPLATTAGTSAAKALTVQGDPAGKPVPTSPTAADEIGATTVFEGLTQNGRFAQLVKDRDVVAALSEILQSLADLAQKLEPSTKPATVTPLPARRSVNRSVQAATSSVLLLDQNINRLGATVYNATTFSMYIMLADATASTTQFTVRVVPNAYYEVPYGYTGRAFAVFEFNTGSALVTEFF